MADFPSGPWPVRAVKPGLGRFPPQFRCEKIFREQSRSLARGLSFRAVFGPVPQVSRGDRHGVGFPDGDVLCHKAILKTNGSSSRNHFSLGGGNQNSAESANWISLGTM